MHEARRVLSFLDNRSFNICVNHFGRAVDAYTEFDLDIMDYIYRYLYHDLIYGINLHDMNGVEP